MSIPKRLHAGIATLMSWSYALSPLVCERRAGCRKKFCMSITTNADLSGANITSCVVVVILRYRLLGCTAERVISNDDVSLS
ncbi:uncharacterized protein EI90DRAFT_3031850 [Cantharellus anzutake]|uniref:uncharacterized protein n=1 Tax=Cantharellus anzutake TaxID=1750568 RepID=UPI0019063115|nr:uncharacterized protein EI90DRAFT_3031850 [Cantharellus anzutake]KAF8342009.1 hypothetical protein EI90DRAFT_3031850 [Cantharellus anzutake]